LAYILRAPILRSAASLWIIDTPPAPASAIVVLGGGMDTRPFAAAKLYHTGYAAKILIPKVQPGPTEKLGLARNDSEIIHDILVKQGVPESALEYIGTKVSSTYEESLAVKTWLAQQPTTATPPSILIPTELFYTRRTRWIFQQNLGSLAQPIVISIPAQEYTADNWWTTEDGLIAFQNEVIKSAYYHWKY
jgi:uncharacterized SAM-binding protein YcdF (DUF218 family)